ncbi:MAG: heme ABC transporter ATP-binding protein [Pseudomonadota bacterium]
MGTVTARDIHVRLGGKPILHGVNLTATSGAVTCIIGPNGCGKTTLLKAMTGEVPFTGEATINGDTITSLGSVAMAERRAVLPQATNLAFPFTVLEVVRIGLTAGLSTADPANAGQLPMQALERVGLSGFEGRYYQELSGGEKQRVQLARILVQVWDPVLSGNPRWVFLDEPVSALDIAHQLLVMDIVRDFAAHGGGVIAVMHDLNLTAMIADHVLLMSDGREVANGPPEDVLRDNHLNRAYGCQTFTRTLPPDGQPWLLPQAARRNPH